MVKLVLSLVILLHWLEYVYLINATNIFLNKYSVYTIKRFVQKYLNVHSSCGIAILL